MSTMYFKAGRKDQSSEGLMTVQVSQDPKFAKQAKRPKGSPESMSVRIKSDYMPIESTYWHLVQSKKGILWSRKVSQSMR